MSVAVACKAMIEGNNHYVSEKRQLSAVEPGGVARADRKTATVKRNQHRALRSVVDSGSPDVEHQAVLAHAAGLLIPLDHHPVFRSQVGNRLRTTLTVAEALANPGPGRRFPGRHEAVLAAGRRAVRNAFELLDARGGDPLNLAGGRLDHVKDLAVSAAALRGRRRGWRLRGSFLRQR